MLHKEVPEAARTVRRGEKGGDVYGYDHAGGCPFARGTSNMPDALYSLRGAASNGAGAGLSGRWRTAVSGVSGGNAALCWCVSVSCVRESRHKRFSLGCSERGTEMTPLLKVVYQIVDAAGDRTPFERGEEYHLKLTQPTYMPLVIEAWGQGCARRISVAHYYEQNGDLVADPDILMDGAGMPLEISQPFGYTRVDREVIRLDVLRFMRLWASNIRAQGWVELATTKQKE